MTQLDHCVLPNEILGPVLSCRFISKPFPLEHKKLMFMFRLMIMLTILMSLVGTKLNRALGMVLTIWYGTDKWWSSIFPLFPLCIYYLSADWWRAFCTVFWVGYERKQKLNLKTKNKRGKNYSWNSSRSNYTVHYVQVTQPLRKLWT